MIYHAQDQAKHNEVSVNTLWHWIAKKEFPQPDETEKYGDRIRFVWRELHKRIEKEDGK